MIMAILRGMAAVDAECRSAAMTPGVGQRLPCTRTARIFQNQNAVLSTSFPGPFQR